MIKFLEQEGNMGELERDDFTIKRNILNRVLVIMLSNEEDGSISGVKEL